MNRLILALTSALLFLCCTDGQARNNSKSSKNTAPAFKAEFTVDPDRITGVRADTNFSTWSYDWDPEYHLFDIRTRIDFKLTPAQFNTTANRNRVRLKITGLAGGQGYVPEGIGLVSTYPQSTADNVWGYIAFREPKNAYKTQAKLAVIVAEFNGFKIGSYTIWVKPVFQWLTTSHKHGPSNVSFSNGATHGAAAYWYDYQNAMKYAKWKYDISTSSATSLEYSPTLTEAGKTFTRRYTSIRDIRIGPNAFSSENRVASTLLHENWHAAQSNDHFDPNTTSEKAAERPAYQFEMDNRGKTHLSASEVADVQSWLDYYDGKGPRPD